MSHYAFYKDGGSKILIDTREIKDEISLTWRIANFSKMHKKYHLKTEFSLTTNSTTWMLELKETCIGLKRIDGGDAIYCGFKASLVTLNKTYENQLSCKCDKLFSKNLLVFDHHYENISGTPILKKAPLEFQDDVFELRLDMKISGPTINNIRQSADKVKLIF